MATTKVQYECVECHATFPRWLGQCTECSAWNALLEVNAPSKKKTLNTAPRTTKAPQSISSIDITPDEVVSTNIKEVDRVLGTGLVKGSVTLMGGEPGIGKSTLCLQMGINLSKRGLKVLYVSGEESEKQISLRAQRLNGKTESLYVLSEHNCLNVLQAFEKMKPDLIIIDSIQVLNHPELGGTSGTVNQVRQCAMEIIEAVKYHNSIGIIIGHITKDGHLAGPKVLEHLVDVIMNFEGERTQELRIIRSMKNRYANTNEIAVMQMNDKGLEDATSLSELFMDPTTLASPGSVVAPIMEGSRAILTEIQALVVETGYGMGKRTFVGVDSNRAQLSMATIEKRLGLKLQGMDVFLNVVGGLKITETATDLAIIMAIISSHNGTPLPKHTGVIGEVGLTGEIRPVTNIDKRLKELESFGFTHCLVPERNRKHVPKTCKITPIWISSLEDIQKYCPQ
ncbi:DNA repair protein RadA [bacterium]|jgi:DNA repair protein RadA/Sms|nr:DNA repair protein RadA [bacterium]